MIETVVTTQRHCLLLLRGEHEPNSWLLLDERRHTRSNDCGDIRDKYEATLRLVAGYARSGKPGILVMEVGGEAFSCRREVDFSNGFVRVEQGWEGCRIGTYMLNRVVVWATEHYPTYHQAGIALDQAQATSANKMRRNMTYARFGFGIDWTNPDLKDDAVAALKKNQPVANLKATDRWQKRLTEYSVVDGIVRLAAALPASGG